ncbi:MAG TPA: carboxymuconolactone decarboxylase family protein [Candidatus Acidoferrales bacterium]|nr:carboxymuconolactone decarboxylase family protein [Candidatus Acidoferrales bacterium]
MSRQSGISEEQILAVPDFRTSELFSPREKAVLEYAEEMTRTPVAVSDELFDRLRQHFSDDQLVELTASIAFENYRARCYHALDIGSDGLFVCALPKQGSQGAGA